jgi:hypothetical protein
MMLLSVVGCMSPPQEGTQRSFLNKVTFGVLGNSTVQNATTNEFKYYHLIAAPMVAIGLVILFATQKDKLGISLALAGGSMSLIGVALDKIADLIGIVIFIGALVGIVFLIIKRSNNDKTLVDSIRNLQGS